MFGIPLSQLVCQKVHTYTVSNITILRGLFLALICLQTLLCLFQPRLILPNEIDASSLNTFS